MAEESKTLKVRCFITGEENIFHGDYLKSLEMKYGSRENILKYYISFKAKNLFFKGYSIKEIRKILVTKEIELEPDDSEQALEIIKYWQDQKSRGKKFNIKEEENISFVKTDPDVKNFIDGWKSSKLLSAI